MGALVYSTNQASEEALGDKKVCPSVKVKIESSMNKCMVMVFWDRKGFILT